MIRIDKSAKYSLVILFIVYITHFIITGHFIPCLIHKVTGLYCPGCGITRMLISLFRFDFYQAFRYNPLLFIMLILTILYQIIKLITYKLSTKIIKLNTYVYISLLVLTIAFGILRNIPYFSYLIPTIVN